MRLFLKATLPDLEPVPLGMLKAHLRLDDTADDAIAFGYLIAAREMVEADIGQSLGSRTLTATMEAWPTTQIVIASEVASVTSITYTNAAGSTVAWTGFIVRTNAGGDTLIRPATGQDWPTLGDDPVITITATGGLDPVPERARVAVLMLAAHFHENREATAAGGVEIPLGYRNLVSQLCAGFIA